MESNVIPMIRALQGGNWEHAGPAAPNPQDMILKLMAPGVDLSNVAGIPTSTYNSYIERTSGK